MTTRKLIRLFAVLALLAGAGCTRIEQPAGQVTLTFSTGIPATRADDDLATRIADGRAIAVDAGTPDLVVLIAAADGTVVARYPAVDPVDTELDFDPSNPSRASITFRQASLTEGTYTVYAFANTQGLWAFTDGTDSYTAASLTGIASQAVLDALYFTPLTFDPANDVYPNPALQGARLPLSAKGQLSVSARGNGEVSLDLLRCVAQVDTEFRNDYISELDLTNLSVTFHHLNPATGYVLQHTPDFPAGAQDGNLIQTQGSITIPTQESGHLTSLVFPSEAPEGKYTCDVTFDFDADQDGTPETYTYTDLEVQDNRAVRITSLSRNQSLHILIRISRGQTVSFNFSLEDWVSLTETVLFE